MASEEEEEEEEEIIDVLSYLIKLSSEILEVVEEAESFQFECSEVGNQVSRLREKLRSALSIIPPPYERPIRLITADASKSLHRTLTIVNKCSLRNYCHCALAFIRGRDFRKLYDLLQSSIRNLDWFLTISKTNSSTDGIFTSDTTTVGPSSILISPPPICYGDQVLSWIWTFIASLRFQVFTDRIDAANGLASIARDSDRNKSLIIEEGGIPPLLNLFKDSKDPAAQIAASTSLFHLANNQERVKMIAMELGVPIIAQVLAKSPMKVQILAANLVSTMAEHDEDVQEDLGRENVIRTLAILLSFGTISDDPKIKVTSKQSVHSVVQISKDDERKRLLSLNFGPGSGSGSPLWSDLEREERENERPETKLTLKINCAKALWKLARGSVPNCRRITETKLLFFLAKLIEREEGELMINCLMIIMYVMEAAETNTSLRRAAFKMNSSAAKAVLEQLLRLSKKEPPSLQIPAITSIGSLARSFTARHHEIVGLLVELLSHKNEDVATEAAISLGKFACEENFLSLEHSKAIIEFNAVPSLMRLLRGNKWSQRHALNLLCYLAISQGESRDLQEARGLVAASGKNHVELKELVSQAINSLDTRPSRSSSRGSLNLKRTFHRA